MLSVGTRLITLRIKMKNIYAMVLEVNRPQVSEAVRIGLGRPWVAVCEGGYVRSGMARSTDVVPAVGDRILILLQPDGVTQSPR